MSPLFLYGFVDVFYLSGVGILCFMLSSSVGYTYLSAGFIYFSSLVRWTSDQKKKEKRWTPQNNHSCASYV